MTRILFVLVLVNTVLFQSPSGASAQELTADDFLEFWQPHEGVWQSTYETEGKSEPCTFSFIRARNGKCFLLYATGLGGAPVQQLQGYDPVGKKTVAWAFTGDGSCWLQTIEIDGMKKGMKLSAGVGGTWESRVSTKDGKTSTTTEKWSCTHADENKLVIAWSEAKKDGQPQPDARIIHVRQPDQRERRRGGRPGGQSQAGNDYVEFWRPLVGSWKSSIEEGDKALAATWRVRLSRNNMCLLTFFESEGVPSWASIDGFDPGTKKWTTAAFDSEGGYMLATIEFAEIPDGKSLGVGVIGKSEVKKSSPAGTITTATSLMACTEYDEKRAVFTESDRKADGEPASDRRIALERQPDRGRRQARQ